MSLVASVGSVDNLDEPLPFFNDKAAAFGFVITFLAISTLCASLRLYVRFFVTRCPGWDDYFIILIFILTWVTNVGCLCLFEYGLGKHFIKLGVAGMSNFVRMFWWVNACYNMSMAAIKLSILFQFLRMLNDYPGKQPYLRLVVITLIVITAIWGVVYSVLAWVPSIPVSADWTFSDTTATRYGYGSIDIDTFATTFMVHGATNMALDIAVFSVPLFSRSMWATAGRQKQSRIAMLCLYGLGIVSVVCSIIRFASLVQHKATTSPAFDPTFYGPEAIILSVLEVDIATIVASLPVFWPYLRRNIDRIMITHEIEVKVTTESFTQIDDQTDDLGREQHPGRSSGGKPSEGRRPENHHHHHHHHHACTPWDAAPGHSNAAGATSSSGGDGAGGAGLKFGSETAVMMRDLGPSRTGTGGSGGTLSDRRDLPFDGSQGPAPRSPARAFFMSRDSKEGLLRR